MKTVIINSLDIEGGAAIAAHRLLGALSKSGVEARMLVQRKLGDDPLVIGPKGARARLVEEYRFRMDCLPLRRYPDKGKELFSIANTVDTLLTKIEALDPEIINLHWVARGFLQIESIKNFTRPIIWTLHDMWAFTGGCHYDGSCGRYINECGLCPFLKSTRENDLSRSVWKRKMDSWKDVDITIVTPSKWLAECAQKSSLFKERRVKVIPNGLDTDVFKPADKIEARKSLGLPLDKLLVLFGAVCSTSERRKGFHLLEPALKKVVQGELGKRVELVVFGTRRTGAGKDGELSLPVQYVGNLSSEAKLASFYAAADVFVAPSLEDNLPNTISESLSCGTPVAAFNVGGIPDMVEHKKNGYLVKACDAKELGRGIEWILSDPLRLKKLGDAARAKAVKEYALDVQARRYLDLFKEIVDGGVPG